jgi:hypothetical protein
MLDRLNKEIANKVREREAWRPRAVFRTAVCLLSSELSPLKEISFRAFPMYAPDAEPFYPWIGPPGKASIADEVKEAIRNSTDAQNIQHLVESGRSLSQTGQVVFVASLPVTGQEQVVTQEVSQIWAAFAASGVTWIPLLIVVVPPNGSQDLGARLAAFSAALSKQGVVLGRLFLIGAQAPSGYRLTKIEDSCSVAAHLVQWLTRSAAIGNPGVWVEWLNGRGGALAAGFGAFTLALPMQSIMSSASMIIGAELLARSCEKSNQTNAHAYYVQRFLLEHHLLDIETLQKDLYQDKDGRVLPNPLAAFPDRQKLSTESFIATLDALDASLPSIAQEHGATMNGTAKARLAVWRNSLEDFIASIVNSEEGGLHVAALFTKRLAEHLQQLTPKRITEIPFDDPSSAIRGLAALLKRLPSLGARLARAALIAVCAGVGLAWPGGAGDDRLPLAMILAALPFSVTLFVHWLRAREVSGRLMKLQTLFDRKWSAQISPRKLEAVKECARPFTKHLLAVHAELEGALRRSAELQDYLKESYSVELPAENASLRFTPRDSATIAGCAKELNVVWPERVHLFLGQRKPLLAWRRFSPPRPNKAPDEAAPTVPVAKPNAWEWNLIEQAALAVLPDCAPLLDKTILGELDGEEEASFNIWLKLFTAATEPLIRVKPGMPDGELRGRIETAGSREDAMVKKVATGLSKSFSNLDIVEHSSSPYRLTALGLRLGVAIENVAD